MRDLLPQGAGPLIGSAALAFLFVNAILEYSKVEESHSGDAVFGMASPAALGLRLLLLGAILMVVWRATGHERFFGRRAETVDPDVAAGRKLGVAAVPEEAVT